MSNLLLKTKLHVPTLRSKLLTRRRLFERLDAGLQKKLILISAPAGFGKTTLVASWVRDRDLPAAWLSLDPDDNAPGRFWDYFIAALQTRHARIGENLRAGLHSSVFSTTETFLTELINEIQEFHPRSMLVMDDFQVIDNLQIQDGLLFILDHLPPGLQLVIVTRSDPPWPLGRLRGQADMIELRIIDLRLTLQESAEFLNGLMELDLQAEDLVELDKRAEGWITGLQLAGLSMQRRVDKSGFIHGLTGTQQFILDYLVEEVLNGLTSELQRFLLQTSVLSRLTAPLCDALLQGQDSQTILVSLEKSNLFLIPLDDERRWFRYHSLFKDLLYRNLQQKHPDLVRELHTKASQWYEAYGILSEAVSHAFQSGDMDLAARLIEENALTIIMIYTEHLPVLVRWLETIPEPEYIARPWLAVARAWILAYSGDLDTAKVVVQKAEQTFLKESPSTMLGQADRKHLEGFLAAIRGYCAYMEGDFQQTTRWLEQAMLCLPEDDAPTRVFCAIVSAAAAGSYGDLASGIRALTDAASRWWGSDYRLLPIMILCEQAGLELLTGKLNQVQATCAEAVRLSDDYIRSIGVYPPVISFAYSRWCYVLREQNDLQASVRFGQEAVQIATDWGQKDSQSVSLAYLGLALQAVGREVDARQRMHQAREVSKGISESAEAMMAAFEADLRYIQGDRSHLVHWADSCRLELSGNVSFNHLREYLVYVRYLLVQGRYSRGLELIERLLPVASAAGAMLYQIPLLILQALMWAAHGHLDQAVVPLRQALHLAEPEGYMRVFMDEGPQLRELLQYAFSQGIAPAYVQRILSAWDTPTEFQPDSKPDKPAPLPDVFRETLTRREVEILRLLMTDLSTAAIAETLCITPNTLNTHIRNIYSKLQVHSRMQAVSVGRELNL